MKVAAGGREVGVKFPPNHDIVVLHVKFPKDQSFLEDLIDLNRSTLGLLLAGKTEQVLDDVMGSLRLFIELFDVIQPARENKFVGFQ